MQPVVLTAEIFEMEYLRLIAAIVPTIKTVDYIRNNPTI
jgi:hypothetical protein